MAASDKTKMKCEGGFMGNQRGVSLSGLIWALAILGFLSVMAANLMPAYIEYFTVKKILASMEQAGDLKGSVRDIRKSYSTRHTIDEVNAPTGGDLAANKE